MDAQASCGETGNDNPRNHQCSAALLARIIVGTERLAAVELAALAESIEGGSVSGSRTVPR
jgi:hypothetical protein